MQNASTSATEANKERHKRTTIRRAPQSVKRGAEASGKTTSTELGILTQLALLRGRVCNTLDDKYAVLQMRDDLIAQLQDAAESVSTNTIPSCPDMCPEKERYCRQLRNLLDYYELDENGQVQQHLVVKEYTRSAANTRDAYPHEMRDINVLDATMEHLISKVDGSLVGREISRMYDFVWNRTRAIRKELTQQRSVDPIAARLVEQCARFHIYASFAFACRNGKGFDERMNMENLTKSLQTLRHMYEDLAKRSIYLDTEPEFRAYDLLLNMPDSNVMSVAHSYRQNVRESQTFCTATSLVCAYQSNNYVRFFRLVKQRASFLEACVCRLFFGQIRAAALRAMCRSFRAVNQSRIQIAVSMLTDILALDNETDAHAYLAAMKINVVEEGWLDVLDFDGQQLLDSEGTFGFAVVASKVATSVHEAIAGRPAATNRLPAPINSFDASSAYTDDPVLNSLTRNVMLPKTTPPRHARDVGASRLVDAFCPSAAAAASTAATRSVARLDASALAAPTLTNGSSASTRFKLRDANEARSETSKSDSSATNGDIFATATFRLATFERSGSDNPPRLFAPPPALPPAASSAAAPSFAPRAFAATDASAQAINSSILAAPAVTQTPSVFGVSFAAPQLALPPPARTVAPQPTLQQASGDEVTSKSDDVHVESVLTQPSTSASKRAASQAPKAPPTPVARPQTPVIPRAELLALSRRAQERLCTCALGACVDTRVRHAAAKLAERERLVQQTLAKHRLRIVRPYARHWLAALEWRRFFGRLPSPSVMTKRLSSNADATSGGDAQSPLPKRRRHGLLARDPADLIAYMRSKRSQRIIRYYAALWRRLAALRPLSRRRAVAEREDAFFASLRTYAPLNGAALARRIPDDSKKWRPIRSFGELSLD